MRRSRMKQKIRLVSIRFMCLGFIHRFASHIRIIDEGGGGTVPADAGQATGHLAR